MAHEALIRGWKQLREWINEDRAALRTKRRLTEAAREWAEAPPEKRDECLFRGARLAVATNGPRAKSLGPDGYDFPLGQSEVGAKRSWSKATPPECVAARSWPPSRLPWRPSASGWACGPIRPGRMAVTARDEKARLEQSRRSGDQGRKRNRSSPNRMPGSPNRVGWPYCPTQSAGTAGRGDAPGPGSVGGHVRGKREPATWPERSTRSRRIPPRSRRQCHGCGVRRVGRLAAGYVGVGVNFDVVGGVVLFDARGKRVHPRRWR